ncbi:hypothetical protein [Leucobacter chromiisoli]|nr:hypothetical protein [Leucobacter chromiisoli]
MTPEYLWALAGVVCIVGMLVTIRIGTRKADPSDVESAPEQGGER